MALAVPALKRAALLRRLHAPDKVRRALDADATVTDEELDATCACLELRQLRPWVPELGWDDPQLPPVLLVRGHAPDLWAPRVAIVGARAVDDYGHSVTGRVAKDAVALGAHVVSGGAEGVDAVAHQVALQEGGLTSVVLAGGHDHPYPAMHRTLFDRVVASGGAVMSAYWPTMKPAKYRFLRRNRVIAALSRAVVVTRARGRSGSLSTARHAFELGRSVLAVPGNVGEGLSAGPHALLASGAANALTGPRDLALALGVDASDERFASGWPTAHRGDPDPFSGFSFAEVSGQQLKLDLHPSAQTVKDALDSDTGLDLDTLVMRTGLPASDVVSALTLLQLVGDVQSLPGQLYRAHR